MVAVTGCHSMETKADFKTSSRYRRPYMSKIEEFAKTSFGPPLIQVEHSSDGPGGTRLPVMVDGATEKHLYGD